MYITPTTVGPYPPVVSNTKKPDASSGQGVAAPAVPEQSEGQQTPNAIVTSNSDNSRTLLSARQSAAEVSFVDKSAADRVRSGAEGLLARFQENVGLASRAGPNVANVAEQLAQSPSQRAAAAYSSVETQQNREELIALLGLNEFA
jgi:hypothetical protein